MKRYLPFLKGTYQVAPGLSLLTKEQNVFEIDENFEKYHENKVAARDEDLSKYYVRGKLKGHEQAAIVRYIARTLAREYPQSFELNENEEVLRLTCKLTSELITFDDEYFDAHNSSLLYDYRDGLDAIVSQIPEDVAIWRQDNTKEFLDTIHLCSPNHWDPREKVQKSFNDVHAPVGNWEENLAPKAQALVKSMITKGPFERFAWGLATDQRLNHHPTPKAGVAPSEWAGRSFDPKDPSLFVRVERQVLIPFRELSLSLFLIRTYFYEVKSLTVQERQALVSALRSMTPETLHYKGLAQDHTQIIDFLESLQ